MPLYRIRIFSSQKPAHRVERPVWAKDLHDAATRARQRLDAARAIAVPGAGYDSWAVRERDPLTRQTVTVASGKAR